MGTLFLKKKFFKPGVLVPKKIGPPWISSRRGPVASFPLHQKSPPAPRGKKIPRPLRLSLGGFPGLQFDALGPWFVSPFFRTLPSFRVFWAFLGAGWANQAFGEAYSYFGLALLLSSATFGLFQKNFPPGFWFSFFLPLPQLPSPTIHFSKNRWPLFSLFFYQIPPPPPVGPHASSNHSRPLAWPLI